MRHNIVSKCPVPLCRSSNACAACWETAPAVCAYQSGLVSPPFLSAVPIALALPYSQEMLLLPSLGEDQHTSMELMTAVLLF